ncbi:hypothetical protein H4R33_000004 [Dimargaris cristalligena]|nr:hypothetical protein H4R33_000004 [Dimargaris cristalligena]
MRYLQWALLATSGWLTGALASEVGSMTNSTSTEIETAPPVKAATDYPSATASRDPSAESSTSLVASLIATGSDVDESLVGHTADHAIEPSLGADGYSTGLPSFEEWRKQAHSVGTDPSVVPSSPSCDPAIESSCEPIQAEAVAPLVPGIPATTTASTVSATHSPARETKSPADTIIRPGTASDLTEVKGRFNHASVDCAAVVIKANPEAKGSSAILTNSKEKYMLNPCSASRFVIIELCDDILIDAIAIANFEFFSSTFKEFTVQVTDRYPPKHNQWKPLGRFQAKNSRETQIFLVRDPIMWTRFIRIDFVTHYGSEYYCPVSMVRVYGNTIMEQYKKEEEDLVAGIDEPLDSLLPASRPDPQPKPWIDPPPPPPPATTAAAPKTASHLDPSQTLKSYWDRLDSIMNDDGPTSDVFAERPELNMPISASLPRMPFDQPVSEGSTPASGGDAEDSIPESGFDSFPDGLTPPIEGGDPLDIDGEAESTRSEMDPEEGESTTTSTPTYRPPPSSGGTQESIFKTIMKRLGWLDRNLTLTYQYLEQQSHAINDVLTKIDYSHHQQLQQAFSYLNSTTTKQIQALKITCEEIWKAIIFDVEDYEHKSRKEIEDIHTRLHYLTQELIFEKRMRIAQLILLLVVILVIGLSKALKVVAPPALPEDKKDK